MNCFELLLHPPYSSDLASSDYYLFADLKRMLTEAHFEAKDQSFYMKGIDMLSKRSNECIVRNGDYVGR